MQSEICDIKAFIDMQLSLPAIRILTMLIIKPIGRIGILSNLECENAFSQCMQHTGINTYEITGLHLDLAHIILHLIIFRPPA